MKIKFNDEIHKVKKILDATYLPVLYLDDGSNWYIAESAEAAGAAAAKYWRDMAENDPVEFGHIVGVSVLINWALGQADGPGLDMSPTCLEEWLDIVAQHPKEEFASYDGQEVQVQVLSRDLHNKLGFNCSRIDGGCVIYRHN